MKHEYQEGPEAAERFKRGMKVLFQVPKEKVAKRQPKKATARKTRGKRQG